MKRKLVICLVIAALIFFCAASQAGNPACRFIFDEVHCEDAVAY